MAMIRLTERPHFKNPWAEFERIRRGLNELSQNLITEGKAHMPATVYPPINMFETTTSLLIQAELPGITSEDLDVSIEGDTLSLQGKRQFQQDTDKISYHRREITIGNFSRSIALPIKVNLDTIKAKLIDGILTVTLDKADEVKPRQITISTEQ